MSLRAMLWVLDVAPVKGAEWQVMVALADEADDDGLSCYPGLKRIARRARVDRSTVIRRLEGDDGLEARQLVLIAKGGGGRGDVNHYALVMGRDPLEVAALAVQREGDKAPWRDVYDRLLAQREASTTSRGPREGSQVATLPGRVAPGDERVAPSPGRVADRPGWVAQGSQALPPDPGPGDPTPARPSAGGAVEEPGTICAGCGTPTPSADLDVLGRGACCPLPPATAARATAAQADLEALAAVDDRYVVRPPDDDEVALRRRHLAAARAHLPTRPAPPPAIPSTPDLALFDPDQETDTA